MSVISQQQPLKQMKCKLIQEVIMREQLSHCYCLRAYSGTIGPIKMRDNARNNIR